MNILTKNNLEKERKTIPAVAGSAFQFLWVKAHVTEIECRSIREDIGLYSDF